MMFRPSTRRPATTWLVWLTGVLEALLLARLVARALAARPDNPAFALLYGVTDPLVTPFLALQPDLPPFGAALEWPTVLLALLALLSGFALWRWRLPRATTSRDPASNSAVSSQQ
ncbi:MAG: YggT family protein [Oscillochloridaceae bacterium]|nr:YggT family protein [Chloroflexaceae bacterium]MDW8389448.1 YggT family protein [Oscillochloridaceae bacterium]